MFRRSLIVATAGAFLLGGVASAQVAGNEELSTADPARQVALVHWQMVLVEQMSSSVCLGAVANGALSARAEAAAETYAERHNGLRSALGALEIEDRIRNRLLAETDKLGKSWWKYRTAFDDALHNGNFSGEIPAMISVLDEGMADSISKIYKYIRRDAERAGHIDLGAGIAETTSFSRVYKAERMVRTACFASLGTLGRGVVTDARKAIAEFSEILDTEEASPMASAEAKALIPVWRDVIETISAAAGGTPITGQDAVKIAALLDDWIAAHDRSNLSGQSPRS